MFRKNKLGNSVFLFLLNCPLFRDAFLQSKHHVRRNRCQIKVIIWYSLWDKAADFIYSGVSPRQTRKFRSFSPSDNNHQLLDPSSLKKKLNHNLALALLLPPFKTLSPTNLKIFFWIFPLVVCGNSAPTPSSPSQNICFGVLCFANVLRTHCFISLSLGFEWSVATFMNAATLSP